MPAFRKQNFFSPTVISNSSRPNHVALFVAVVANFIAFGAFDVLVVVRVKHFAAAISAVMNFANFEARRANAFLQIIFVASVAAQLARGVSFISVPLEARRENLQRLSRS